MLAFRFHVVHHETNASDATIDELVMDRGLDISPIGGVLFARGREAEGIQVLFDLYRYSRMIGRDIRRKKNPATWQDIFAAQTHEAVVQECASVGALAQSSDSPVIVTK
ncbi:hypothetical protein A0H81_00443 [Grifola frondosa]|uniref:Uncharacterized protein n=1 Tax=Grifola frondosa TaxID=5627 RepID=A0A1C7MSY0_GRIFR|nr:hypothetical protein A0H81_00443 [Grifola frondosa]